MRPLFSAALVVVCLAASLALPTTTHAADPAKVAVIVGPVGSLTPTYLALAEAAASAAERNGATVARAYSPNATPANVLAAVADANVIVYFGHGYGHPSPYGGLNTARQNGWALQGPRARGTHDDGLNGFLTYYGEDWIVAKARPAPGFVMIYSNTCYAPGASEGGFAPATPTEAAQRVAYYSRKVFTMGGSAYFATDFDRGAADLVDRILAHRAMRYGDLFAADHRYVASALTTQPHLFSQGQQIWLHRSKYTDGPPNYWYAFAGNPDATPRRSWDPIAPTVALDRPGADATDVAPSTEPKLRLSEAVQGMNASTVHLLDGDGQPIAADVHVDAGTVRVEPKTDLALSTRYTIEVGKGITDLAGNPLKPARWTFTTRLDADAWSAFEPVLLAQGDHRLVRFAPDGTVVRERVLDAGSERRVPARTRARMPGAAGTWLELATGSMDGWWVAESPRAHVVGPIEEAAIPATEVTLVAGAATTLDGALLAVRDRVVTVDRRSVVDGRTYLRTAGEDHAPTWFLAPASAPMDGVAERRILERLEHADPVVLDLDAGEHRVFRFDRSGFVVDRRTVARRAHARPLTARSTMIVAGRAFHVLDGGKLDGWAIAASDRVRADVPEDRDPT